MWEWMTEHAEKIGAGILAVGAVFTALWGKALSMRTEKAKTGADVAIAESQREVFEQMKERLAAMSDQLDRTNTRVDSLMDQVRDRDNKIHRLEMYVIDLQHTLHQHGIDPPPMRS